MVTNGICKIDGTKSRPADGEPLRFLREIVLNYDGDECLTWPFARNEWGYGIVRDGGRNHLVSRYVCREKNGPPPTPKHEAAHSCGRGKHGCCTQGHLSWKTRVQNQADRLIHGTHNRGERCGSAKLTEPEVREIIALKGRFVQQEIADTFGVSRTTVSLIHARKLWAWL